jgi:hypothetical protein
MRHRAVAVFGVGVGVALAASAARRGPATVVDAACAEVFRKGTPARTQFQTQVDELRGRFERDPQLEPEDRDALRRALKLVPRFRSSLNRCVATNSAGSWSIALEEAWLGAQGVSAAWHLEFISPSETVTSVRPPMASLFDAVPPERRTVSWLVWNVADPTLPSLTSIDLDRDGAPEAIAWVTRSSTGRRDEPAAWEWPERLTRGSAWTVRDGAIVPFSEFEGVALAELRDVDRDGRIDAISHGRFEALARLSERCASWAWVHPVIGPKFLHHAGAKGTFETNDAEAKRFIRTSCPSKPTLAPNPRGDLAAEANKVACARVWGASSDEIEANLIAPLRDRGHICEGVGVLEQWSKMAPPTTLP